MSGNQSLGGQKKGQALGIIITAIPILSAAAFFVYDRYAEAYTAPVAGYTHCILLPPRIIDEVATPEQTIIQYEVFNPGPAVLENTELSFVVLHAEGEDVGKWLSTCEVGPVGITRNESNDHIVYKVFPSAGGNAMKLGAGKRFGVRFTASKEDWKPSKVNLTWGNGNHVEINDELSHEKLFRGSQSNVVAMLLCVLFAVSFPYMHSFSGGAPNRKMR